MSHVIQHRIDTIRQRTLRTRLATGVCWVLTTALSAALVLGMTDYLLRYVDPGLRILSTAALVLAAGWAVTRFLLPLWRRPLTSLAVAERLENAFPQLEDRLASSLEFLDQPEDDPLAGSAELRRAVIADTATRVEQLRLESAIDHQPARRAAKWLAVVVAVLLVAVALDASSVGIAARRLLVPLGNDEWPRQHRLAFHSLPKQLAVGATFEAEIVDDAGDPPDDVTVHYRTLGERGTDFDSQPAERIGEAIVVRRDDVRRTFEVRATGGDDFTMPWHKVEVVEPPRIDSLHIIAHPPKYTGQPASESDKHLEVLEGTRLEVKVSTNSGGVGTARVRLGSGASIEAVPVEPTGDAPGSSFNIAPEQWIATETDTYCIELEDERGLVGASDHWHLRVEPDPPPTVRWRQPQMDLFVLPQAVVPISLSVRDNLAIQSVDMLYLRSDESEAGERSVRLFTGPEQVAGQDSSNVTPEGDERTVDYTWELSPLDLNPGVALSVTGRAADYRPGLGETPGPRRIVIINRDELDQRIADRQNQIARRLEQALTLERTTRDQVRRVDIQARDVGRLGQSDRDTLQSARLGQRRVESQLVDPAEGVPAEIAELLAELAANNLQNSDIQSQMRAISNALEELAEKPLPTIEQQLTAVDKALDRSDETPPEEVVTALSHAGIAQDEVITRLEDLLSGLSKWAGYQRFARDIAQLRKEQVALRETTQQQVGVAGPVDGRQQAQWGADVNKLAEAQHDLSRRFDKLNQDMQQSAAELAEEDAQAAATLQDALDQARELGVAAELREAALDFRQQRVGRASANQQQAAEHLAQLLATLRNRREHQLDQMVAEIRKAEHDLAQLRDRLAELRERIEQSEQLATNQQQQELDRLRRESDQVQKDIERMARRLNRLQAELAGQSAQRAANDLAQTQGHSPDGAEEQQDAPPSGARARQAEENLKEAAKQLAEARRQAEQALAEQQLARLESAIRAAVDEQLHILRDTEELDELRRVTGELSFAQLRSVLQLAERQQALHQEISAFGEVLGSMGVFRVALGEAAGDMQRAVELLNEQRVDTPTIEAEQQAHARLKQIAQALERNPPPPQENQGGQQGGAGQGGQQGPQVQLAEIKLLRMLQDDLRQRTLNLREQAASGDLENDGTLVESASRLAAEQGRLAELVLDILSRDNENAPREEPVDNAPQNQELRELLDQLDETR